MSKTNPAESIATNLQSLSEADWRQAHNAYMRGIDWMVSKAGARWAISERFGKCPTFKTKTAAYDTVVAAFLIESRRRASLRESD